MELFNFICSASALFEMTVFVQSETFFNYPRVTATVSNSLDAVLYLRNKTCTVFLSSFSINLLAFYHQCCSLIGYATHYLFGDR